MEALPKMRKSKKKKRKRKKTTTRARALRGGSPECVHVHVAH
jgi:hypothetical protein